MKISLSVVYADNCQYHATWEPDFIEVEDIKHIIDERVEYRRLKLELARLKRGEEK